MKYNIFTLLLIMCTLHKTLIAQKKPYLVGLAQVRNEAPIIKEFAKAFSYYVDELIFLDDASTDETPYIIKQIAPKLTIPITLIKNTRSAWQVDKESANRQKLLEEGRKAGGTHFVLLDADEILSANCLTNNWFKTSVSTLIPGQMLFLNCVNFWDGLTHIRSDKWCKRWHKRWTKLVAFCDNKNAHYLDNTSHGGPANILHSGRFPKNLTCLESMQKIYVRDTYTLLHFKYARLQNIYIKKVWYMCLEYIRAQECSNDSTMQANLIKEIYNNREFECLQPKPQQMKLRPIPQKWVAYPDIDFSVFTKPAQAQQIEIFMWLEKYGEDFFKPLELDFEIIK